MAKTNFSYEKRQRELEKKRKAEEKARRKEEAKHHKAPDGSDAAAPEAGEPDGEAAQAVQHEPDAA